jgi:hypothetical protein
LTTQYEKLQEFYLQKSSGLGKVVAFGAGMLISDLIVDNAHARRFRQSQDDDFNRHVSRAADRRKRRLNKEFIYTIEDLNDFYKEHSMTPPRQGQVWDAVKHRWTNPDHVGKTVIEVQGKKRIRGTGTGMHERSVGGHGKGIIRGEEAGRKFRSAADIGRKEPTKGTHPAYRFGSTKGGKHHPRAK